MCTLSEYVGGSGELVVNPELAGLAGQGVQVAAGQVRLAHARDHNLSIHSLKKTVQITSTLLIIFSACQDRLAHVCTLYNLQICTLNNVIQTYVIYTVDFSCCHTPTLFEFMN